MRPLKRPKIDSEQKTLPFLPLRHEHVTKILEDLPNEEEIKQWRSLVHQKYADWMEEPCLPLERMNAHPRDAALIFIDTNGAHMYLFFPDLEPNPHSVSVTTLKKQVIPDQGFQAVAEGYVQKDDFLNGNTEWSPYLTADGVLLAWDLNREQAAEQGTVFHRRVEGRLNEPFATTIEDFKVMREIQKTCGEPKMQAIHDKFDILRGQAIFLLERKRFPVYQHGAILEKVGPEIIPVIETWWEEDLLDAEHDTNVVHPDSGCTKETNLPSDSERKEEIKDDAMETNLPSDSERKEEIKDDAMETNLPSDSERKEEIKDDAKETNLPSDSERKEEIKDDAKETNLPSDSERKEEIKDDAKETNLPSDSERKEEIKDDAKETNLPSDSERKEEIKDDAKETNLPSDSERKEEIKDDAKETNLPSDSERKEEIKDDAMETNIHSDSERKEEIKEEAKETNLLSDSERKEEIKDDAMETNLPSDSQRKLKEEIQENTKEANLHSDFAKQTSVQSDSEHKDPMENDERIEQEMIELSYFDKFWKTFCKKHYPDYDAKLYRTEMRIWDKEALVPGTIDCVIILIPRPGRHIPKECEGKTILLILDWKRSKKLEMQYNYGKPKPRFLNPPFQMLQLCNGSEFTFQLNAYKYIMEKLYRIDGKPVYVLDMYACVFNRCLGGCQYEKLRDVSQSMHKFMQTRIQHLKKLMNKS